MPELETRARLRRAGGVIDPEAGHRIWRAVPLLSAAVLSAAVLVADPAGQRAAAGEAERGATGEAEEPAAATASEAPPEVQVVAIDTTDFQFNPEEITVVRGVPVRFEVTAWLTPHAFSIPQFGLEQVTMPPETGSLEWTFEEVGDVMFRCRFHHRQGMIGTIHVVEPEPAANAADDSSEAPEEGEVDEAEGEAESEDVTGATGTG